MNKEGRKGRKISSNKNCYLIEDQLKLMNRVRESKKVGHGKLGEKERDGAREREREGIFKGVFQ